MSSLPLQFLLLTIAGWMTRDHQRVTGYLLVENAVLREQLRGRRIRYTDGQRRRLATAAKKLGRKALKKLDTLVTPDTLLRWYRRLVAAKYDSSARSRRSQPRRPADIVELVLRMAKENATSGYTRIRGALFNLGHEIGRNTIKRILLEAGIDPAPERSKRMSWSSFLRAHWGAIAAMDFYTVEVVTWTRLVRFHILFVVGLATRRVEIHRDHGTAARGVHEAGGAQPHRCRRGLPSQAFQRWHITRAVSQERFPGIQGRRFHNRATRLATAWHLPAPKQQLQMRSNG